MSGFVIHTAGKDQYLLITPELLGLLEDAKAALGLAGQHSALTLYDQPRFYQQYLVIRALLRKLNGN